MSGKQPFFYKDKHFLFGLALLMSTLGTFTLKVVHESQYPGMRSGSAHASSSERVVKRPLDTASVLISVTDIYQDGNIVSFIIPEDARQQDKTANTVRFSGLYDVNGHDAECPVVSSKRVSKSVQDYNPVSGEAHVDAIFSNPEAASMTYEAGCVIIDDLH